MSCGQVLYRPKLTGLVSLVNSGFNLADGREMAFPPGNIAFCVDGESIVTITFCGSVGWADVDGGSNVVDVALRFLYWNTLNNATMSGPDIPVKVQITQEDTSGPPITQPVTVVFSTTLTRGVYKTAFNVENRADGISSFTLNGNISILIMPTYPYK